MKTIDCNKYLPVTCREDADQVIIPFDVDGKPQPPIYLASKNRLHDINTPGEVEWSPSVSISRKGSPSEYCALVDWWFENATTEFKQSISKAYGSVCNVPEKIEQLKLWLKSASSSQRKARIDLFLQRCLAKEQRKKKGYGLAA